ncbi:MAG: hypothetical protein RMK20_02390, partial [Verrucomicrobiales bacterium]|nr:hypothetical protein [Verrucomicrobiales bacterium]
MRWRVYFFVSLALNGLLLVGWGWSVARQRETARRAALAALTNAPSTIRTNVLVRRQFFSWQEIESDDYATYIANLRAIGCPEQTIRDIIIADVNALFARRRAVEVVTPEQQWWRTEPDTNVLQQALEKIRALEQERRDLLTSLLGPGWETGDLLNLPRPSRQPIPLDGPILGALPDDVKHRVEEISIRSEERIRAYVEAQRQAGREPDPAELARLRQQTRTELAGVLSPLQLEEFLLRYSQNASALRAELRELKHFEVTPEEFRAMFRAIDQIDLQRELLGTANDPNTAAARRALEQQRLAALQNVLGPERFELFQKLHDPDYRDAYARALAAGAPESADTIYELNRAAREELARIRQQTNVSPELREIELKKAELELA